MSEGIGDLTNKTVIDARKKDAVWTFRFAHTATKVAFVGTAIGIVYHFTKNYNIEFTDMALSQLEEGCRD